MPTLPSSAQRTFEHLKEKIALSKLEDNDYALLQASKSSRDIVQIDPNMTDEYGCTLLHYAAMTGRVDIMEKLIKKGATKDFENKITGENILHYAAKAGSTHAPNFSIKLGLDVNGLNNDNKTALNLAVEAGHSEIVDILLVNDKVKVNSFDLSAAISAGHVEIAHKLINDSRCDVSKDDTPHRLIMNGLKKLIPPANDHIKAIANNYLPLMNKLLEKEGHDRTLLHFSEIIDNPKAVKYIVETGMADPKSQDIDGHTPLHFAAVLGRGDTAKLLLEHSPQLAQMIDNNGYTAHEIANINGNTNAARVIEANGLVKTGLFSRALNDKPKETAFPKELKAGWIRPEAALKKAERSSVASTISTTSSATIGDERHEAEAMHLKEILSHSEVRIPSPVFADQNKGQTAERKR